LDYEKLCSSIFEIDPKIRAVLIYHTSGELLAGGMRPGVESYLPREEITKSTQNAFSRWKRREELSHFLGPGKYTLTEFEKVKRITFPLETSALLMMSMEVESNHDMIIQKILEFLK